MTQSSSLSNSWPPLYRLRKHLGARRIKFKISLKHGLEVTVPRGFNLKELPSMLEKSREWIETQLLKRQEKHHELSQRELPVEVDFKALQQKWKITYVAAATKLKLLPRPGQELVLFGPVDNKAECFKLIKKWSKILAERELIKHLEDLSAKISIPFSRLQVRSQQGRWGSCSSSKSLSLNYKLIFLRPELMRHVMIHELCHTLQMNHSDKFWNLVAQFDVNWQEHRRELKKAATLFPAWLNEF